MVVQGFRSGKVAFGLPMAAFVSPISSTPRGLPVGWDHEHGIDAGLVERPASEVVARSIGDPVGRGGINERRSEGQATV